MAHAQTSPAAAEAPFVTWLNALVSQLGYTKAQGSAFQFPGCTVFINTFGSCFGNNTASPYIVDYVPPQTTNILPMYLQNAFTPGMNANNTQGIPTGSDPHANIFYQLGDDEAVVTIITLPPLATYYSLQTSVALRQASQYNTTYYPGPPCTGGNTFNSGGTLHTLTPDCISYVIFSPFYNAINDVKIFAQASVKFSAQPPYTAVAIVTTSNHALFGTVRAAFASTTGMVATLIVEEQVPTAPDDSQNLPLVKTASTAGGPPDELATIIRYTLAQNATTGNSWVTNAVSNVLVYRIKEPVLNQTADGTPTLTAPSCNTNETGYTEANPKCMVGAPLDADLALLANTLFGGVQARFPSETYRIDRTGAPPPGGGKQFNCIIDGTNCAGGTQDTDAYRSIQLGLLPAAGPTIVIGVLHSASAADTTGTIPANNATYTGVSIADDYMGQNTGVYDFTQANASAAFISPQRLQGSAYQVLSDYGLINTTNPTPAQNQLYKDLPNLYAVVFNRVQSGVACQLPGPECGTGTGSTPFYVVNIDSSNGQNSHNFIDKSHPLKITERGYLLPLKTPQSDTLALRLQTGADARYLESPYVLCDSYGGLGCPAQ